MVGGVVIQGLKNAIKLAGKRISKAAVRVSNSWIGRKVTKGVQVFGAKMAKNVKSKRWWSRAVRVIRSNRSMLGALGKIGTALKKSGGLMGLFGRGLSIFDVDFRSPKEYRKSIIAKEKQVEFLKKKRSQLIAKELEMQKESKIPVVTEGIETPEGKLDEMAKHLTLMKESIGTIRATSTETAMHVKGFENYQIKANENISDAINYGTQTNMKALAAGLEDVKDVNKAIAMDSTESIVGDITAKIDAIEEEKKREQELRRKNNWVRKLLNFTLFVADWILNWPWKLTMLALKVGAFITAALALFYLKNIVPIKSLIKAGPLAVINYIGSKLVQLGSWIGDKIVSVVAWLYKKIIGGVASYAKWIGGILSNIPVIGKYIAKAVDKIDSIEASVKEGIDNLRDNIKAGLEAMKETSRANAEAVLKEAMEKYKAEAKLREAESKDDYKALKADSPEGVSDTLSAESDSSSSKSEVDAKDSSDKDSSDKSSTFSKLTEGVRDAAGSALDKTAKFMQEERVEERVVDAKESIVSKGKEIAFSAKESIKDSEAYKEIKEHSEKNIEKIKEAVSELGGIVKSSIASNAMNSGGAKSVANPPTKIDFEESANTYKARL